MELLGEKIRLRPIEKSDMDDFYSWWNDPQFAGEYAGDYPKGRIEVEELVKGGRFFIIESRLEHKKMVSLHTTWFGQTISTSSKLDTE